MKPPVALVKEKYGDKAKLVAEIERLAKDDLWVERTNKQKGLGHVSNAKLLRLHDVFTAVQEKFGTRAKLIAAILDLEKRSKDDGYKTRLERYPAPRLWDLYRSLDKRHTRAMKAPKKAAKKPETATAVKAPKKKAAKAAKPTKKKT